MLKKMVLKRVGQSISSFLLLNECIEIIKEFYPEPTPKEVNTLYNECRKEIIEKSHISMQNSKSLSSAENY